VKYTPSVVQRTASYAARLLQARDVLPAASSNLRTANFKRADVLIDVSRMAGYLFPKFGPQAHNPLQRVCETYVRSHSSAATISHLVDEIAKFRPNCLAESLFGTNDATLYPLTELEPLVRLEPWTNSVRTLSGYLGQRKHTFGAVSLELAEREARRLCGTVDSAQQFGYRPEAFKRGFIRGYFLLRNDDYRFIVTDGMHRLAALAALGVDQVRIRTSETVPAIVDCASAGEWPHVRSGFCSLDLSLRMAGRYFD